MTCKHLGGRGLLLQRLARLGDEPRILHRDDRLVREGAHQLDLLLGERLDPLAREQQSRRSARLRAAAARRARCARLAERDRRDTVYSGSAASIFATWTTCPSSSNAPDDSRRGPA